MVTLILPVKERSLDTFRQTLLDINNDINEPLAFLCVAERERAYLQVREFLPEFLVKELDRPAKSGLVVYGKPWLQEARKYLDKNSLVFLWGGAITPAGVLRRLYQDYIQFPKAGLISGLAKGKRHWFANDVYALHHTYTEKMIIGDIAEIDTVDDFRNVMTKSISLIEQETAKDVFQYGALLRQSGYINYIDKRVGFKEG